MAEEKVRIVLDGLPGETPIAELCRREGIAESMSIEDGTYRRCSITSARLGRNYHAARVWSVPASKNWRAPASEFIADPRSNLVVAEVLLQSDCSKV